MDWLTKGNGLKEIIRKYKYAVLILCVGILLMTFPKGDRVNEVKQPAAETEPVTNITDELTLILSQIQGVGKVRVMLTELSGAETHYQTDEDRSNSPETSSVRKETVIVSIDGNDQGLIRSVTPPVYLGAIIVCQGGGDPAVRLAVTQAVSSVTGIGTDRITVLKMK